MRRFLVFILLISLSRPAKAQSGLTIGTLPVLHLTLNAQNKWRFHAKIESRFGETMGESGAWGHLLTDLALMSSRKVTTGNRLTLGFLQRFRNDRTQQRVMQQYTIIRQLSLMKISHRLASDQTFGSTSEFKLRFRYRLLAQIPLDGLEVNAREWYLKVANEYLQSWQAGKESLEVRLTPAIGYDFFDNSKLELGLDYRLDRPFRSARQHRLWWALRWYVSF